MNAFAVRTGVSVVAVCALAMCACRRSHVPTPRTNADAAVSAGLAGSVASRLQARYPDLSVRIVDPDTLAAGRADAGVTSISLDNLRLACTREPAQCDQYIDRQVAAVGAVVHPTATTSSALRAVVRDGRFVDQANERLAGGTDAGANRLLARPLIADLFVAYVIDRPDSMAMVSAATASELGLTPDQIHQTAMANSEHAFAEIPYRPIAPGSPVFVVHSGDSYESSRFLFPAHWEAIQHVVHGDLLVSVPIRDAVLFTGSLEPNGLAALRTETDQTEEHRDHPVSRTIFRWTRAGWEVLEQPPPTP